MFKRLFVTVGPTPNAYKLLIDQVISNSAFWIYRIWKVESICIQGAGGVPAHELSFVKNGVNFTTFGYKDSLIEDIQQSDLVLCYAGDLIALKALQLGKLVIMFQNPVLVDTRHLELSTILAEENYATMVNMYDCFLKLANFNPNNLRPFPPMQRELFSEQLWERLNKAMQQPQKSNNNN